jgi:hypothetical protein
MEIAPELVERMAALIRDLHADHLTYAMHDRVQDFVARTAAIVAELPKPVDPDLIEARNLAASRWDREDMNSWAQTILSGACDGHTDVTLALTAIKRGRELAGGAA